MSTAKVQLPDIVPVLSRGKHRNARKGACFMEMASFLAGERWSDHPPCTHPLLAAVARLVNDNISDDGRQRLTRLIPSVIGLTSEDVRVDARIGLRCATMALPVVAAERQNALAVSVLVCDRILADLDGRSPHTLLRRSSAALDSAPHARYWAEKFIDGVTPSMKAFRRHAAPQTVRLAVEGVASACIADTDSLLVALLEASIEECTASVAPAGVAPAGVAPAGVAPAGVAPAGVAPAEVAPPAADQRVAS
jgi:hypothetical protein